MEKIDILGHSSFWVDKDGILNCKIYNCNTDNRLDFKTAQLFLNAIEGLTLGKPMPFLLDFRGVKGTFSNAAGQALSEGLKNSQLIPCEAYVVNSLSIKLLVRTYKRLYHPNIPYNIFNDLNAAKSYCLTSLLKA